jgi:hypothetical protein
VSIFYLLTNHCSFVKLKYHSYNYRSTHFFVNQHYIFMQEYKKRQQIIMSLFVLVLFLSYIAAELIRRRMPVVVTILELVVGVNSPFGGRFDCFLFVRFIPIERSPPPLAFLACLLYKSY